MKIDGRKASQDFYVKGKRIYCWKKGGSYLLGMNGTNLHFKASSKTEAQMILNSTDWEV